jgi:hypothetical protein
VGSIAYIIGFYNRSNAPKILFSLCSAQVLFGGSTLLGNFVEGVSEFSVLGLIFASPFLIIIFFFQKEKSNGIGKKNRI